MSELFLHLPCLACTDEDVEEEEEVEEEEKEEEKVEKESAPIAAVLATNAHSYSRMGES